MREIGLLWGFFFSAEAGIPPGYGWRAFYFSGARQIIFAGPVWSGRFMKVHRRVSRCDNGEMNVLRVVKILLFSFSFFVSWTSSPSED